MTTPQYHYVKIGQPLVNTAVDAIIRGESVLFLGHANCGKGHLRRLIRSRLKEEDTGPIVSINFRLLGELHTEEDVQRAIVQNVLKQHDGEEENATDRILEPLSWLSQERPILCVANIDRLPHPVARLLVREIRQYVEEKRLVVLLTGESDLGEFVYGPNSELNFLHQYVVQGFDRSEFTSLLALYSAVLPLGPDRQPLEDQLWRLSNGNHDVLHALLIGIAEWRIREAKGPSSAVPLDQIERMANASGLSPLDAHLLRHANRLIPQDPNCWDNLIRLLRGEPAPLRKPSGAPGPLTLSGLAIREGGVLKFSSPLLQELALKAFNHQWLGNLYAQARRWEPATAHFQMVPTALATQPANAAHYPMAEASIRAGCLSMHVAAAENPEKVRELFASLCKFILGFSEITCWGKESRWKPIVEPWFVSATVEGSEAAEETFRLNANSEKPQMVVPEAWFDAGFAWRLDSVHTDQPVAIFVGDFHSRVIVSQDRKKLLLECADHFVRAHNVATGLERKRRRLKVKQKHQEICTEIMALLGSEIIDVKGVLQTAARGLRSLGYRRVAFALVDSKERQINGVLDDSDIELHSFTSWPLDRPAANVHPYVCATRSPIVIENAPAHVLTNKVSVEKGGIQNFAVVPMALDKELVTGTIHFERDNKTVPSADEVQDFLDFGKQLAAIIEQGQRTHMLFSALNKIPDPLAIVNAFGHTLYANQPAAALLNTPEGWHPRTAPPSTPILGSVAVDVEEALTTGRTTTRHTAGAGIQEAYRAVLVAAPLKDWRQQVIGAFLHLEDMNLAFRCIQALELTASAHSYQSALRSVVESLCILGSQWARLYLIDPVEPGVLVSTVQAGMDDREIVDRFESQGFRLSRTGDPGEYTWESIDRGEPRVFRCQAPDGQCETSQNVPYRAIAQPSCPAGLEKTPGDFWIDAPLEVAGQPLGKVTIQCDEDILQVRLDFIKVYLRIAANLLENLKIREEAITRLAADHALGLLAHNIATRFGSLSILLSDYRDLERRLPELAGLNDTYERKFQEIYAIVNKAKETFRGYRPSPVEFDLVRFVRDTLAQHLPESQWGLVTAASSLIVRADRTQLGSALVEMIKNAQEARARPELFLRVGISAVPGMDESGVQIIVEDNGQGVAPHLKKRIFEDFFTHRPGERPGTGLGLALVRRVVEGHGGTVIEDGEPGGGARFVIDLPSTLVRASANQEAA